VQKNKTAHLGLFKTKTSGYIYSTTLHLHGQHLSYACNHWHWHFNRYTLTNKK